MTMKYTIKPEQHDNTLLLSDLLELKAMTELKLAITLPHAVKVTIIDDLTPGESEKAQHSISFTLKENSELSYQMRLIDASIQSLTKELDFNLAGSGAHASAHTTWLGKDDQQLIVKTMQHHQVPHTSSNCVIKTVLNDRAHMQCTSMIKVDKDAQHTQAEQSNKNIMLSPASRAVSVPQLEIEADDVSCKHGAAMSRFDDEQKFYLQSRGINNATTQQLLIEAFLAS